MPKYRYFTNKRHCPYMKCKLKCYSKRNHHAKYASINKKNLKKYLENKYKLNIKNSVRNL